MTFPNEFMRFLLSDSFAHNMMHYRATKLHKNLSIFYELWFFLHNNKISASIFDAVENVFTREMYISISPDAYTQKKTLENSTEKSFLYCYSQFERHDV